MDGQTHTVGESSPKKEDDMKLNSIKKQIC